MNHDIFPVVLAGGAGTRLWPLSDWEMPKQFLRLGSSLSLLQNTLLRLQDMALPAPLIAANAAHAGLLRQHLRDISARSAAVIFEPAGRNTAASVALAALQTQRTGKDPLLLVLPADHLIGDSAALHQAVQRAAQVASLGYLTALGTPALYPETRYGYIVGGAPLDQHSAIIASFVEKPDADSAAQLVADPHCLWNSGIFMFRASDYLNALQQSSPATIANCRAALATAKRTADTIYPAAQPFSACAKQCINRAVMEKSHMRAVVGFTGGWTDIGHWRTLFEAIGNDPTSAHPCEHSSVTTRQLEAGSAFQHDAQAQHSFVVAAQGAGQVTWQDQRVDLPSNQPLALPHGVKATIENPHSQPLKLLMLNL